MQSLFKFQETKARSVLKLRQKVKPGTPNLTNDTLLNGEVLFP